MRLGTISTVPVALACCSFPTLLAAPAAAQDADAPVTVSIGGSTRVRGEAIGGQPRPTGPASDAMLSFSTSIEAKVKAGPLTIGGELRDARAYGEADDSTRGTAEVNALEPLQGYAALDLGVLGIGGASVTGGRFSMELGSGRLVGSPAFSNSVQSYLGGRFDWANGRNDNLTLFWTRPFQALPSDRDGIADNKVELDRANGNVTFFGGIVTKAKLVAGADVELYAFRFLENDAPARLTRNRHVTTFGGRVVRAPAKGAIDFELEVAGQHGRQRAGTSASDKADLTVRAAYVHATVGRSLPGGWNPRVAVVFDYATGDGRDPATYGRFDNLFGARRGDFGPTSLFGEITRSNLVSPGLRLEGKPAKRLDFFVMARGLWLATSTDSFAATGVRDATGQSGRFAGFEVEARARRWLVPKRLRFELGGAWLAKGHFLRDAPNARHAGDTRYVYSDLTYSF
ncbi:MAG: alginate export family protein [Pseudomonadota bacterium]